MGGDSDPARLEATRSPLRLGSDCRCCGTDGPGVRLITRKSFLEVLYQDSRSFNQNSFDNGLQYPKHNGANKFQDNPHLAQTRFHSLVWLPIG